MISAAVTRAGAIFSRMSSAQRVFFIFGFFFVFMGPVIILKEYFDTKRDVILAKTGIRGKGYVVSDAHGTIEYYGSPVNRQKRMVYYQTISGLLMREGRLIKHSL